MERTQISLTTEERRVLDAEAARTGRSLSHLIRSAVDSVYGIGRDVEADLAAIDSAFGSWSGRDGDTAEWVDGLRSGRPIESIS